MADKKKYPWIKSIFKPKKHEPIECVYAGPEYFARKNEKPEVFEDVYAGPEFFEKDKKDNDIKSEGTEAAVEEEPEAPNGVSPTDPEENKENGEMYNGVYAGPAFFNDRSRTENIPPQMFMTIYAGPDYYNNKQSPAAYGMFLNTDQSSEEKKDPKRCPVCGAPFEKGQKFCLSCGAVFPEDQIYCSQCGNPILKGQRFCSECGHKVETEK